MTARGSVEAAPGARSLDPRHGLATEAGHLSAYIPGDRRRALAEGTTLPERVYGAALFADISGFTPLSEALANELGSERASEALSGHLSRVFHALIDELDRYGGEVIYFSGDAITCWLEGDDGLRAAASGLRMQEAILREGQITTPGGLSVQLGLKVAVAAGGARRFVVGDPEVQLIDVLAGGLVDRVVGVESLAEKGEVLLHESALEALDGHAEVGAMRVADGAGPARVIGRLLVPVHEARAPEASGELSEELSRPWLLPSVYERIATGGGAFLAELRPAYSLFVSFGGIDYDGDERAPSKLDEFVRAVQRVLVDHGGNVLQLTLGDKGAYLYGVFGTPHAHEDDAERACAAALELRALEQSTPARAIRTGISFGRVHSGAHGHKRRQTFTCLGDAVNLAARLMSKAPAGGIYISEPVRRRLGAGFESTPLGPLKLKGKAEPTPAFALTDVAQRPSRRARRYELPIVGRNEELGLLRARLGSLAGGGGAIVGVAAEAGMGKSRLVAEFLRELSRDDVATAVGECQSFGTNASYFVWREIGRTLLGVPADAGADDQLAAIDRSLAEIDPALCARAPLLDGVLGLTIPDTELTASFEPETRKTSLENLLADVLRARARVEPLVLVLEDCHWLDPLSRDLLDAVARVTISSAVLLVLLYRPEAALPQGLNVRQLPGIEELSLSALDEEQMAAVVDAKLGQLLGDRGRGATALRELVCGRAQGNPFYAEELLNFIHDRGIDPSDPRALRSLELPDSLHSLVLSRIDTLTEGPRRGLKVASVIGREFQAAMLPGISPELGAVDDVRADLKTLRKLDLVLLDREGQDGYLFKHAVTQEVAYESLPFEIRATLHGRAGAYIERDADVIDRSLDLLAHHYWHSDDEPKKIHYLGRAAESAKASYANVAAIDYYERLAPLLSGGERVDALLGLGSVLEHVGDFERASEVVSSALEQADAAADARAQAWCAVALGEIARKQSRYGEAGDLFSRARAAFEATGDNNGLGRVAQCEGTAAAQQGEFDRARSYYEQSLALRRELGDAKLTANLLNNLGIVAEYEGDYALANSFHEQALELRKEAGDRWGIAQSMTNLGMIATLEARNADAVARFDEAMRLQHEVGDRALVALTHNNLGNANRGLGDFAAARTHYLESLLAQFDREDRWALAFLLEDVARFAAMTGDPELALELLGASDGLREEIGSPRAPTLEHAIEADVMPAAEALAAEQVGSARARGRTLDRATAIALARSALEDRSVGAPTEANGSAH